MRWIIGFVVAIGSSGQIWAQEPGSDYMFVTHEIIEQDVVFYFFGKYPNDEHRFSILSWSSSEGVEIANVVENRLNCEARAAEPISISTWLNGEFHTRENFEVFGETALGEVEFLLYCKDEHEGYFTFEEALELSSDLLSEFE